MNRAVVSIVGLGLMLWAVASGAVDLDFRATSALYESEEDFHYTLSISDCRQVSSVQAGAAGELSHLDLENARPKVDGSGGCEIDFSVNVAASSAPYTPAAEIKFLDAPSQTYSENFSSDDERPDIELESVDIVSDLSDFGGQGTHARGYHEVLAGALVAWFTTPNPLHLFPRKGSVSARARMLRKSSILYAKLRSP